VTDSYDAVMRLAIEQAAAAAAEGDVPVGAVIVDDGGLVVGCGYNRRESTHDATAHAEVMAIRQACEARGSWRLLDCTLVVTLEPCTMCAGACVLARLGRVVYGAPDPKAGAVGSLYDVLRDRRQNHRPEVVAGVLEAECRELLAGWFEDRRTPRLG
jgi:tRNA(adenine34) deaminase